jgi:hypothetical protein
MLRLHCKVCYTNAPQCHDIHTLNTLFVKAVNFIHIHCVNKIFVSIIVITLRKRRIIADDKSHMGGDLRNKMRPYGILRSMQNERDMSKKLKKKFVHKNNAYNSPHFVLPGIYYEHECGTSAMYCESRIIHCQLRNCRKWTRDVLRRNSGTQDTYNEKKR